MDEDIQHSNDSQRNWQSTLDCLACPCFEPTARLPWSVWPGKFRPPLGAPWEGICRADSNEPYRPAGQLLLNGCNLGYARDSCHRVPAGAPDAVRFAYAGQGIVRWALEADHRPVAHGASAESVSAGQGSVLDCQLNAYRASVVE